MTLGWVSVAWYLNLYIYIYTYIYMYLFYPLNSHLIILDYHTIVVGYIMLHLI